MRGLFFARFTTPTTPWENRCDTSKPLWNKACNTYDTNIVFWPKAFAYRTHRGRGCTTISCREIVLEKRCSRCSRCSKPYVARVSRCNT
jgi:hypothetical protein